MLSKYINKIEHIILELNGKKIEKINGVLIPEYLYSFPNGLWLSFELDQRDNYFDVKLGRLFSFDDVMPRIIVLESIEYYFSAVNELKLGNIKYEFSHTSYEIENVFEMLMNNLKAIIENYPLLKENEQVKDKVFKEEKRLKLYLLKDLSYSSNLELDLKDRIESFNGRINKLDASKVIRKVNKRKQMKCRLMEELGGILVGFVAMIVGLLFAWLLSSKKDISDVPFEVFFLLGLVALFILVSIVGLIALLVNRNKQ